MSNRKGGGGGMDDFLKKEDPKLEELKKKYLDEDQ